MNLAIKSAEFLVYSNLYVALLLAGMTWATYSLQLTRADVFYISGVFFGSLALYNFHRIYRHNFRGSTTSSLAAWARRHVKVLYVLIVAGMAGGLFCLFYLPLETLGLLVPAAFLSVWYTVPVFRWKKKWYRLREIPFFKPWCIALVVAYVTFLVPYVISHGWHNVQPATWFLFSERTLFLTVITIPFDIRDVPDDSREGLHTLPVVYGFDKTIAFAYTVLGLWAMLLSFHAWYFPIARILTFNLILLALTSLSLLFFHKKRGQWYYNIAFEGLIGAYIALAFLTGLFF